jgi:mycoredoxin
VKIEGELSMLDTTLKVPVTGEKIKVYATTWCGDCRLAKRWFDAHGIAYDYINIEEDERAAELVMHVNGGMRSVPTIVFPDGSVLVEPSARELAAKLSK